QDEEAGQRLYQMPLAHGRRRHQQMLTVEALPVRLTDRLEMRRKVARSEEGRDRLGAGEPFERVSLHLAQSTQVRRFLPPVHPGLRPGPVTLQVAALDQGEDRQPRDLQLAAAQVSDLIGVRQ